MPIDLAVPSMIFIACSTSFALRSGILSSAISRICSLVTVPTFCFKRISRAFFNLGRFFEKIGRRRSFQHKIKSAVFIYRDFGRNHLSHLVFGRFIELGAKFLDIEAMLSQSRTNRRRRIGLPGFNLKFITVLIFLP